MLSPASPRSSSLWNISERQLGTEHDESILLTNTSQGGLHLGTETDNLNFGTLGNDTSLDFTSGDGTSTWDGEDILDVHQEWFVQIT